MSESRLTAVGDRYACSPFQAWALKQGVGQDRVTGVVRVLADDVGDVDDRELCAKVCDLVEMTRVACVDDPLHGPTLLANAGREVLEVGSERSGEWVDITLSMPLSVADPQTLRQLQTVAAAVVAGREVAPSGSAFGLRYARWQDKLSRRGGTVRKPVTDQHVLSVERSAAPAATGGRWTRARLDPELSNGLDTVARDAGVSPQALLLGTWQHLLSLLYDGCATVWVAFDGRRGSVPAETAGQLMSVRPWQPSSETSVGEGMAAAEEWIGQVTADPVAWKEEPEGLPAHGFQMVPAVTRSGDTVLGAPVPTPWSQRLLLAPSIGDDGVEIGLWHESGRIPDADADELLATYMRLLARLSEILSTPGQRWLGADPTDSAEGATATAEPGSEPRRSLWSRVTERARRAPTAVAVRGADEVLTYAELTRRAADVADRLRAFGVGAESRVAVHMAERPDLIAAMLGVLAAGGAYVPVSVDLPRRRADELLALSGASAAIADDAETIRRLGLPGLAMEELAGSAAAPAPVPRIENEPESLAYVLHTSGSTGTPKGVMVTRRGLNGYIDAALGLYGLGPDDTVISQTPAMFDLSVTALLLPLAAGATVELVDSGTGLEEMLSSIRRVGDVALLKLTPGHLALLPRMGLTGADARIRRVVVGGEQLATDVAACWTDLFPESVVVNEYGPTETVVGCTVHTFNPSDLTLPSVPIGKAIPGAWARVCEPALQPLEAGLTGELLVGGHGVARGYTADPRLTAERFVPDPFGPPGSRAYRTGDLVVRTASSGLSYRGRTDRQLSLRGYRIEPAEVEGSLRGLPGVTAAVVKLARAPEDEQALVAYVVLEQDLDTADLRRRMLDALPVYMVPRLIQRVSHIPMTDIGKVDLSELPEPQWEVDASAGAGEELESIISGIWSEVLGVPSLGLDDRLFEVGGDSFSLVKINARMNALLECKIPMPDMFNYPTIRELAEFVRGKVAAEASSPEGTAPHAEEEGRASHSDRTSGMSRLRQLRSRADG